MATGFLVASGASKVIGGVKQNRASKKAANSQYALDQENIRLQKAETAESVRRTEEQQQITQGSAANQIGASGFAVGSSLDRYLETAKAKNASDIDWMRTSGASRDAISAREASARKRNSDAERRGQNISNAGSALGSFGAAGSQYDKTKWGF